MYAQSPSPFSPLAFIKLNAEHRLTRTPPHTPRAQFVQCVNYGPTSRIGEEKVAQGCAKVVGHGALLLTFSGSPPTPRVGAR